MQVMVELTPRVSGRAVGIVLALVTVVLTVISPRPAAACSCVEPPPPRAAVEQTGSVFAGTVVAAQRTSRDADATLIATFEVDDVWKGEVLATVDVRTAGDSATCGVGFATGQRWLVYAESESGDGGSFATHLCTRTARAEQATADLEVLGDGDDPLPGSAGQPSPGDAPVGDSLGWTWILVAVLLVGGITAGLVAMIRSRHAA